MGNETPNTIFFHFTVFSKEMSYQNVGKIFDFASKPEQPELACSIHLEFMITQTYYMQIYVHSIPNSVHIRATSKRIELEFPGC